MNHCLLLLCCLLLFLTSCNSPKDTKDLIKNVEDYHKDLLFERYEIAARQITPLQRAAWLNSIQSQNIHFADIEIVSTAPCATIDAVDKNEVDRCTVIYSRMEWFANGGTAVHSARVASTWQYDEKEKGWRIVEQLQE